MRKLLRLLPSCLSLKVKVVPSSFAGTVKERTYPPSASLYPRSVRATATVELSEYLWSSAESPSICSERTIYTTVSVFAGMDTDEIDKIIWSTKEDEIVFIDVPLLYELNLINLFNKVIFVYVSEILKKTFENN